MRLGSPPAYAIVSNSVVVKTGFFKTKFILRSDIFLTTDTKFFKICFPRLRLQSSEFETGRISVMYQNSNDLNFKPHTSNVKICTLDFTFAHFH